MEKILMANSSNKMATFISGLRKKADLTQSELAERSGISFRTMQRIEAGEVSPRMDLFCRIIQSTSAEITSDLLDLFKPDTSADHSSVQHSGG